MEMRVRGWCLKGMKDRYADWKQMEEVSDFKHLGFVLDEFGINGVECYREVRV